MENHDARVTFTITAGRFISGAVRRALEEYLFQHAAEYHIEERKGFPTSLLLVEFTADETKAEMITGDIEAFAQRVAREIRR